MSNLFSEHPGAHERQLQRMYDNPLFGRPAISPDDIARAQQRDAEEVRAFINQFRELVEQCANLDPNAEADVVLKLKEQLDKSYEQCAGLAGDQGEIRALVKRLLEVIMRAMWQGVGDDMQGRSKLQMESEARESHFGLLEYPLIADLLRPEPTIEEGQLVPTLLSEPAQPVKLAMQLFSPEQQMALCQSGRELLATLDETDARVAEARQRLADMENMLQPGSEMPS